jgi:type I restriction enzyme S subunit
LSSTFRQDFKGVFPYYGACDIIDYVKEYIFDGEYLLIGEDGANLLSKSKPLSFIARGKFWVNNHAHIVKTIDNVNIKYLNYQFNSLQINEYVTGTAQPKLSQRNLYKIPIALPLNLQEQNQIVQEIETRLSVCDKLNESIDQSLEKAQALRQSILKKAFEGKLLSQDELQTCRQQTDWEPAAKLLEKVKKDSKTKR